MSAKRKILSLKECLTEALPAYTDAFERLDRILPTGPDSGPVRERLQQLFSLLHIALYHVECIEPNPAWNRIINIRKIIRAEDLSDSDKLGLIQREVKERRRQRPKATDHAL